MEKKGREGKGGRGAEERRGEEKRTGEGRGGKEREGRPPILDSVLSYTVQCHLRVRPRPQWTAPPASIKEVSHQTTPTGQPRLRQVDIKTNQDMVQLRTWIWWSPAPGWKSQVRRWCLSWQQDSTSQKLRSPHPKRDIHVGLWPPHTHGNE